MVLTIKSDIELDSSEKDALKIALNSRDILGWNVAKSVLEPDKDMLLDGLHGSVENPKSAAVLVRILTEGGVSMKDLPASLIELASSDLSTNDWSLMYLVDAARNAKDQAWEKKILGNFNRNRILPDGGILEPSLFQGSLGLIFRVISYYVNAGKVDEAWTHEEREDLSDTVKGVLDRDPIHQVAGLAALEKLGEQDRTSFQPSSAISTLSDVENIKSEPLSLEEALSWTQIREYADALGIDYPFPGLKDGAVSEWLAEDPNVVAPSVARFLIFIHGETNLNESSRLALLSILERSLYSSAIEKIPSSVLFPALYAIWIND